MSDLKVLAEQLVGLTIKQASDLFDILKNEYGIEPVSVSAPAPAVVEGVAKSTESAVEQSEFDVVLKAVGSSKLAVVKVVKEVSGLGLKEAKDLVDNVPGVIKTKLPKEEAESIKKKLEEVGAEIELK